jgi:hypothetical protein
VALVSVCCFVNGPCALQLGYLPGVMTGTAGCDTIMLTCLSDSSCCDAATMPHPSFRLRHVCGVCFLQVSRARWALCSSQILAQLRGESRVWLWAPADLRRVCWARHAGGDLEAVTAGLVSNIRMAFLG